MPRGDGTGPNGMGPMTGRAAGYCAGYGAPGYMNPAVAGRGMAWGRGGFGFGRGLGLGFRGGRGWGAAAPYPAPYYPPTPVPEQETEALKAQAQYLEESLEAVRKRLAELDTDAS